ncbi:hypothetical protein V5073_12015, partial [Citrobacter braakii]
MKSESFVSVVLNKHDLSNELTNKLQQIQSLLDDNYTDYEILIVSKEGANKQVISSQADSLIKISRIWADF